MASHPWTALVELITLLKERKDMKLNEGCVGNSRRTHRKEIEMEYGNNALYMCAKFTNKVKVLYF